MKKWDERNYNNNKWISNTSTISELHAQRNNCTIELEESYNNNKSTTAWGVSSSHPQDLMMWKKCIWTRHAEFVMKNNVILSEIITSLC